LLEFPEVCQFEVFRRFLCHPAILKLLYGGEKESPQKKSFLRNVFSTVDDQLDSMFHYKKGMIEQPKSIVFAHSTNEADIETSVSSTTEPLIDLIIEMFELKGLRKQAVVLFLQQLFGDTVERKVNESLKDLLSVDRLLPTLNAVRDTYWPNGKLTPNTKSRTTEEKLNTKFESNRKIMVLVPDLFGGLVGRQNARKGAIRCCTLFQNQKLNKHLMYKIFDELLLVHFPKN
jgi:sorting nexin-25